MSTTENIELITRVVEALNHGRDDAVDVLFTPTYMDHDPARADAEPGPAGVRRAWSMLRESFPDLRMELHDTVAEGALVAVRGEITGTHEGSLLGVPATGRKVRMSLIDFNRIAGGRVAERWAQSDTVGLLRQLGVLPGLERFSTHSASDGGAGCVEFGWPPGSPPSKLPAAVSTGMRSPPDGNGHARSRANKALCLRFSQAVLNDHRLDQAEEFLARDFVGHLVGAPEPVAGVDAWREMFAGVIATVPDYRYTVHDVIAEGDLVASRATFAGTHEGELFGSPPTGRTFAADGMAFLRVRDGRIVEQWTEADMLGVIGQIGALEPIGGP